MYRIFISYKRQDKASVFPIVEEIKRNAGVECWIDIEGIEEGDQFHDVIIDAIDNADAVVCMLSQNFVAPYRDERTGKVDEKRWTFPRKEVMYALNEGKTLFPISVDGTSINDCKWLNFHCGGLEYINWHLEEQKVRFLNKIWKCEKGVDRNCEIETEPVVDIVPSGKFMLNSIQKPNEKCIDTKIPLIILFGAAHSGKTMTLMRLCRYLCSIGYSVTFENLAESNANNREECLMVFDDMLNANVAQDSTSCDDFILIKVGKAGRTVCQIFDAAGEYYFSDNNVSGYYATNLFPSYLNKAFKTCNKKVWMFLTDATWDNSKTCSQYVSRIQYVVDMFCRKSDDCLVVYNKADEKKFITDTEILNKEAMNCCYNQFKGLKDIFKKWNTSSYITKRARDFLAFCSGTYSGKKYVPSADFIPAALWGILKKRL